MAASSSAWETRDYSYLLNPGETGDAEAHETDEELTQQEAGQPLIDMLIRLKMLGVLSAKRACILSHWAKLAGIASPGDALALPPERTGGTFSAHFDRVVGLDSEMKK